MGDAASEISDWEVLSAPGGDDGDVVIVCGEGGDVLRDHFALVLPDDFALSGDGGGDRSGAASGDDGEEAGLGSKGRSGWNLGRGSDLAAGDSGMEVDGETAECSVLDAAVAGGAAWSEEERQAGAILSESLEQEKSAAHDCGESGSILQPSHLALVGSFDFDLPVVAEGPQIEALDGSDVRIGDGGVDATGGCSVLEAVVAGGGMHSAQEDQDQGENASAASGCSEPDREVKDDGSLPLAQTPGTGGEGEKQVVVWWRLPFRLLHYCAWKVKPVWSISIAAALLGLVVLGRKMYRMRRKPRGLPQIKMAFDDKRTSQLADRAWRLNEAFLMARRVPAVLRTSSGAVW